MAGLLLSYNEYLNQVRMSQQCHILLEGAQDKTLFSAMLEKERFWIEPTQCQEIVLSTADHIQSEDGIQGNREKVETICSRITDRFFAGRFAGFVDREFREFDCDATIQDKLKRQYRSGRLIWSRGHSIENYLLDFEVVEQTLRDCTDDTDTASIALGYLRDNFQRMLEIGCALGFCAFEASLLDVVRRTIDWESITLENGEVLWNIEKWKEHMSSQSKLDTETREQLANQFTDLLVITRASDPVDVRWACDGHIGLNLLWNTYASIVYHVRNHESLTGPNARNQRAHILGIPNHAKFNLLARQWSAITGAPTDETPALCFHLLGTLDEEEII